MTVHARGPHACAATTAARARHAPLRAPIARAWRLQPQGAGTERIEEALAARFPERDRAAHRPRHHAAHAARWETRWAQFGDAPGILVGTQMLAKGHDLPQPDAGGAWSASMKACSPPISAPASDSRSCWCRWRAAPAAAQAPARCCCRPTIPSTRCCDACWRAATPPFAAMALASARRRASRRSRTWPLLRAEAQREADVAGLPARGARRLRWRAGGVEAHGADAGADAAPRRVRSRGQMLVTGIAAPAPCRRRSAAWMPRLYALANRRASVRWSIDVDPVDLY